MVDLAVLRHVRRRKETTRQEQVSERLGRVLSQTPSRKVVPVLPDGCDVVASFLTRCRDSRILLPCRCGDFGFVSRHKPAEHRFPDVSATPDVEASCITSCCGRRVPFSERRCGVAVCLQSRRRQPVLLCFLPSGVTSALRVTDCFLHHKPHVKALANPLSTGRPSQQLAGNRPKNLVTWKVRLNFRVAAGITFQFLCGRDVGPLSKLSCRACPCLMVAVARLAALVLLAVAGVSRWPVGFWLFRFFFLGAPTREPERGDLASRKESRLGSRRSCSVQNIH